MSSESMKSPVPSTHASSPDSPTTRPRFAWLDALRAVAVLLVIGDHFGGNLLHDIGRTWAPSTFLSVTVFDPLAITQYGGFLGVALFFLISGYIISVVMQRETSRQFVIRRIFRIFPLLAVMVILQLLTNPPALQGLSTWQVVKVAMENVTLLNYVAVPQVVLIGVGWTLAIEVTFYVVALILKPLIDRARFRPYFPVALVAISAFFVLTARTFGNPNYFQTSVFFMYIPVLGVGSVFALREQKSLRVVWAWLMGIAGYAVFLFGTWTYYPQFLAPDESYPVSVVYAIAIFGIAWLCRDRIPRVRIVAGIALISYSLYLVHGVLGVPVLARLVVSAGWPYSLAFGVVLIGTFALSIGTYFLIERPSNALARRLTTTRKVDADAAVTTKKDSSST